MQFVVAERKAAAVAEIEFHQIAGGIVAVGLGETVSEQKALRASPHIVGDCVSAIERVHERREPPKRRVVEPPLTAALVRDPRQQA
jgi:hypothetical protein